MSGNTNLITASKKKNDEFYTQLEDINNELYHYEDHFRGKTIYCNCDDPRVSNFFYYFSHRFEALKLKKLITTCYKNNTWDMFSQHDQEQAVRLEYDGDQDGNRKPDADEIRRVPLKGDGDFRSQECIEILKQADIVVTNPPFSLFREYVAQLMKYNKKFVIIGPRSAITYKEILPLITGGKMWLGNGFKSGNAYFKTNRSKEDFAPGVYNEETDLVLFRNVVWFTNLDYKKRYQDLRLYKEYDPKKYPKYDNYDAIEVKPIKHIPKNWGGGNGCSHNFFR